jgi:twitching motility two-component system response regulator PilH
MIDVVPKTILVVDDTKSIREIVAFMLRGRGYEVLEAADGQEARDKIRANRPDMVLLDAMLPKITGFDLCAEMKADENFKSMPILMLTAITKDSGKSDEYWREKSQADDFMSKPFKATELVARIEKILGPSA